MPHAALWVVQRRLAHERSVLRWVSMPHAALWVVQHLHELSYQVYLIGFNAARGFVGGAAMLIQSYFWQNNCFNAARGFVGGAASFECYCSISLRKFQCRTRLCGWCSNRILAHEPYDCGCFNAARGFVGGAALTGELSRFRLAGFNAARGFVGGAALFHNG